MKRHDAYRLYTFIDGDSCIYCGDPRACGDHAWPVEAVLRGHFPRSADMMIVVPSCSECNSLAIDYVFDSIQEKRDFVKSRIHRKHRKALELPEWNENDEVFQCPNLSSTIRQAQQERARVLIRLRWEPARSASLALSRGVSGNASVRPSAGMSGTSAKRSKRARRGETKIERLLRLAPRGVLERLSRVCSTQDDLILSLQEIITY